MSTLLKLAVVPGSVMGMVLIYKTFFIPRYNGEEDLTGKIAVVTGASSGIGKEIAYRLAKQNATVVLGCRDMIECKTKRLRLYEKTKNANLYCSVVDLESYDSVIEFTKRLQHKLDRIDILVNNAGYKGGKFREVTPEHTEKQLQINVLSPFLLTKLLIPLLNRSGAARVLFLVCPHYSSGKIDPENVNQQKNYDRDSAFNQSQLMRMLLVRYFSTRIDSGRISFNAVDPGPTFSNFHKNESYRNNIVSRMLFAYINMLILRNVWHAAETPTMCCVSEELVGQSGQLWRDLRSIEIDPVAMDPVAANYVYQLCNKWTRSPNVFLENKLI